MKILYVSNVPASDYTVNLFTILNLCMQNAFRKLRIDTYGTGLRNRVRINFEFHQFGERAGQGEVKTVWIP